MLGDMGNKRAVRILLECILFCHFFLSSGVNSNIGNHATYFKSSADDIKSLCRRRQVRAGPQPDAFVTGDWADAQDNHASAGPGEER